MLGWTAIEAGPDGIVAVSVRAPSGPSAKASVVKCAHVAESTQLDIAVLGQVAKKVATPGFAWTLPHQHS